LNTGSISQVFLIVFEDYFGPAKGTSNDRDEDARNRFHKNYTKALKMLSDGDTPHTEERLPLDALDGWIEFSRGLPADRLLLDISTLPRSYLLTALRFLSTWPNIMGYTRVGQHRGPEETYTIGLKEVIALPGFEGTVGCRPTVLVISVGFEGARAYSLFKRYDPFRALAVLGDPGEKAPERDVILGTARRNNSNLLATDSVYTVNLPSYDPATFCELCEQHIEWLQREVLKIQGSVPDIVLAPVGTKLQAVGLFEVWSRHKEYQIAYAVPGRRRRGTEEAGETLVYMEG